MSKTKVRIKLKAFEHKSLDKACADSREQFEKRTHKRLIDIIDPTKETIEALTHLEIPSGVDIRIIK